VTEPRTTAKTDPTGRTGPTGKTDSAAEAVAAAIGRLGSDGAGATAADIAAAARVAYSTTNKKLRALKDASRAESFDGPDKRTMWRLPAGSRATAVSASEAATVEPEPAVEPTGDTAQALGGDPAAAPPPAPVEQPAADAVADTAAASTPAGVTGPDDVEPDGQPGDAEPDDAPGDPSATVEADTANAAHADEAAQPATRPATRTRRTAPEPADGDDAPAAKLRRPAGSLRGAILDIMEADPGGQYKVGQLCKLIDKASEGTGYAKASQGAVYNEAVKLVGAHRAVQTVDKPATFQIAVPPAAD
jgi:hypothetical protein